jgi:uncharacterized membrane protein YqjE
VASATAGNAGGLHPLEAVRTLRSASGELLAQAMLQGALARLEWDEEINRLLNMLLFGLLGFACLLCMLLFAGGVALAATWETIYRMHTIAGLVLLFSAGMAYAWRRLQAWSARGERSFAALREELAADAALLKASL